MTQPIIDAQDLSKKVGQRYLLKDITWQVQPGEHWCIFGLNGCTCQVEKAWNRDTVYWDKKLVGYVKAAAEELGVSHQYIHSGAGHDAQFCSYVIPTTMIFVQSKDGLSHCEQEFSSVKHCTEGASVMLNAVLKADAE